MGRRRHHQGRAQAEVRIPSHFMKVSMSPRSELLPITLYIHHASIVCGPPKATTSLHSGRRPRCKARCFGGTL